MVAIKQKLFDTFPRLNGKKLFLYTELQSENLYTGSGLSLTDIKLFQLD